MIAPGYLDPAASRPFPDVVGYIVGWLLQARQQTTHIQSFTDTNVLTHREWTSNPAQRGYMTSIRYLLYREALAWSPLVRKLEDALTG